MEKTDAEKLIGAFAIALSSSMPKDLAYRIADNLDRLAREIQTQERDTRMHTRCTELAQSIRAAHPKGH